MIYSEKLGGHWTPSGPGWRVHFRDNDGDDYEIHVVGWLTNEDGSIDPLVWDCVNEGVSNAWDYGMHFMEMLQPGEPIPWSE